MASDSLDRHRLTLMVLRLMDADQLRPEEGRALLAEIEAFAQIGDEATAQRAQESGEGLLRMLDGLVQTERLDAQTGGQAQEIVYRILHAARDPV